MCILGSNAGLQSYNYPGVTNGLIAEPDTYRALAKHPKIVGCKMYVLFLMSFSDSFPRNFSNTRYDQVAWRRFLPCPSILGPSN